MVPVSGVNGERNSSLEMAMPLPRALSSATTLLEMVLLSPP